jgi:hypothetical protein
MLMEPPLRHRTSCSVPAVIAAIGCSRSASSKVEGQRQCPRGNGGRGVQRFLCGCRSHPFRCTRRSPERHPRHTEHLRWLRAKTEARCCGAHGPGRPPSCCSEPGPETPNTTAWTALRTAVHALGRATQVQRLCRRSSKGERRRCRLPIREHHPLQPRTLVLHHRAAAAAAAAAALEMLNRSHNKAEPPPNFLLQAWVDPSMR